jgi:hypothetical protein
MAQLNVIQPNFGGLASLAGSHMGNLGIVRPYPVKPPDTSTGEFLGGLAQGIRQNQALALDREKQQMLQGRFDQEASLEQQKIDNQKAQFQAVQDSAVKQLAADESKEKLEARAYTSLMWLRMPEEQKTKYKPQIMKALVDTGLAKEEMGDMDNKALDSLAMMNVVGSVNAMKLQTQQLSKEDAQSQGDMKIYDPNTGNLVYESSKPLTTPNVNKAQETITTSTNLGQSLEKLKSMYDPNFLTWRSRFGRDMMIRAEKAEGIPVIKDLLSSSAEAISGIPKEEQGEMVYKMTKFVNTAEQIFQNFRKETTGAQASDKEIKMLRKIFLNPEMGPNEFKAAMEVIVEAAQQKREISESQLMEGIVIKVGDQKYGPKQQQNQNTEEAQGNKGTVSVSSVMKAYPNMSKEQIILQLQEQGYNIRD